MTEGLSKVTVLAWQVRTRGGRLVCAVYPRAVNKDSSYILEKHNSKTKKVNVAITVVEKYTSKMPIRS